LAVIVVLLGKVVVALVEKVVAVLLEAVGSTNNDYMNHTTCTGLNDFNTGV